MSAIDKLNGRITREVNKLLPDIEIIGIRLLKKIDENKWSFCVAFRDGDFLSLSDEFEICCEGIGLKIVKNPIQPRFVSPGISVMERDGSRVNRKQKHEH